MAESNIFNEAVEAIKKGENERARDLLARLLKTEKTIPEYWLWMSSVVKSPKEKIFCLKNVLQLDPDNESARQGLILLGGLSAGDVKPVPPIRRSWEAEIDIGIEELHGFRKIMANPVLRVMVYMASSVILIGLIFAAFFGTRGFLQPRLTITPIAWTPTSTHTPTNTPKAATITPVFTPTPEPLWMLLESTYTPVPLYVNTPHPRLEAYRLAIRAYEHGNYNGAITFFEQTLKDEPEAVDVHYYLGEAYRQLGDYEKAIGSYDAAIELDPKFAPNYLSRALVRVNLNPTADILSDLNKAIELDPLYGEAYLERAIYRFNQQSYEVSLEDMNSVANLMPTDPRLYLELANLYLALGENDHALENAEEAHERDITLLSAYLVLGKAYLANNMPQEALGVIETYGKYVSDDAMYWALLGGSLYEFGEDYPAALDALDKAESLDENLATVHYYRGMTALALNDPHQAVNDLYIARSLEPGNIVYNIWFGVTLYKDQRYREAYNQFNAVEPLAKSDEQLALIYYYKAKAGMEIPLFEPVKNAWLALLELPEEFVLPEWLEEGEEYLAPPTETPTPTATLTSTLTFTPMPTNTITPKPSVTLSPSPTLRATQTSTPTPYV
jgi:tetratricopeptide (TPR) repeat protein